MFSILLSVALGGGAGAVARHAVAGWVGVPTVPGFGWATFTVNVIGSTLLGLVAGTPRRAALPVPLRTFLAAGFCGGFTTFSAFDLETLRLLLGGRYLEAGGYVTASVVTCVVGVGLGVAIARRGGRGRGEETAPRAVSAG